jgi:hypothetical protein
MIAFKHIVDDFTEFFKNHVSVKPTHVSRYPPAYMASSKYISTTLLQYINTRALALYTFADIGISVSIYSYEKSDVSVKLTSLYYTYIRSVIHICKKYSNLSCNSIRILIYLTPFKKEFGILSTIIGPTEVNSGMTTECSFGNTIVVYRKEEWLKVCMHECIHFFGLDFSYVDNRIYKQLLENVFCLKSDYLLSEALTEFWAEVMYICLYHVVYNKSILALLNIELEHSINQCKKILNFMNINYTDIFAKKNSHPAPKFVENTNVFCYYFLKTLFFYYIKEFLEWTQSHSNTLLSIDKSTNTIKSLCIWIETASKRAEFIRSMTIYTQDVRNYKIISNSNKGLKMMHHT